MLKAVADPGFPRGGGANPMEDTYPLFGIIFLPKIAWKWKQNKLDRGGTFLSRPLDPALITMITNGEWCFWYPTLSIRKSRDFLGNCKILTIVFWRLFPQAVADPGFSWRGVNSQRPIILQCYCSKLHENELIWSRGGAFLVHFLGSANGTGFLQLLEGLKIVKLWPLHKAWADIDLEDIKHGFFVVFS